MQLVRDDGVLDEQFEGDDLECVLVGSFKDDRARSTRLLHLEPAAGADTPAVSGLEAGKAILRQRRGEVVAEGFGGIEKGLVDDAADGVDSEILWARVAAAGAVKAGHRLAATGGERLAKDVSAGRSASCFFGGHEDKCNWIATM